MRMASVTQAQLESCEGQHISKFCGNDFTKDSEEHCAHFVAHLLEYGFGATCKMMGNGKGAAANLRVQEIYMRCPQVGAWPPPTPMTWGLVFIGNAGNIKVSPKLMVAVPRLHMGFFFGGDRTIWHYSNKFHKVITETPEEFSHHFQAPEDNAMFWGSAL